MSRYEGLMIQYPLLEFIEDNRMPSGLSGLYFDDSIRINKNLTLYEKTGVLAEELGHYETSFGNILDISDIRKKKLEVIARRWGYEKLVSLDKLIECYEFGHVTIGDVCVYLEITDTYFENVLDFYKMKYGLHRMHKGYKIYFDPLNITTI